MGDEPFVANYRKWSPAMWLGAVIVPLGAIGWIANSRSPVAIVVGGAGLVCCVVAIALMYATRASNSLVVSRHGIRSSRLSVAWDRVADVHVEQIRGVGETLVVEASRPDDIEREPLCHLAPLTWIENRLGKTSILIPQRVLDVPLADVVRAIEERSGRTLDRATLEPSTEEES